MSDVLYGINMPRSNDPAEMSEFERKHAVNLKVVVFDEEHNRAFLRVEVGKHLKHPNDPGHFIQ